MSTKDVNVYSSCDKAIKALDRQNVEAFGQLKMSKWDEINLIRTVVSVYRKSAKRAQRRYRRVAIDAYLIGMALADIEHQKAGKMAENAITEKWVDDVLSETDFVTLYRFDTETDRKAHRLAETLEVTPDRNKAIDKALKEWSRQVGQYAINITDYAIVQAFQDAGVEDVMWVTQRDERVCHECSSLNGKVFRIEEVPPKPHMGCRCTIVPDK